MISRDAFSLFALAILSAGLSAASPAAGLLLLAAGSGLLMLTLRAWAYPGFLFALVFSLDLLLGGLNLSRYRGEIEPDYFRFLAFSLASLSGGYALGSLGAKRVTGTGITDLLPQNWIILAAVIPGLFGIALMISETHSLPLFQPSTRYAASAQSIVLSETLIVPFILSALTLHRNSSPFHKVLVALLLLLLCLPGYRGWPICALGVTVCVALAQGVTRRTLSLAALAGSASAALLALGSTFRRLENTALLSPADSMRIYDAEYLPQWFAQLHFTLRESIAVGQRLFFLRQDGQAGDPLLFADLATLLPGQQLAAGDMMGEAFGQLQAGGLTALLPAILFHDYGYLALVILGVTALLMGVWWQRISLAPTLIRLALYFLCCFYFIHAFNRGALKPAYFLVPAVMLGADWLARQMPQPRSVPSLLAQEG